MVGTYVSAVALPSGNIDVFVLGTTNRVFGGTIDTNGIWSGWRSIQIYDKWTSPNPTFVAPPRAAVDGRGELLLTGLMTSGELWETRTVYGQWSIWMPSN